MTVEFECVYTTWVVVKSYLVVSQTDTNHPDD